MCQEKYQQYLKAEEKILTGQEYEIEGRRLTRADLKDVQKGLKYWELKCEEVGNQSSGKIKNYRVVVKND
ncbi:hypothetical protein EPT55_08550 [Fusobacterium necrophorum]|nr:hypothetical protein EPT55_08550 [Fusobacterium necrophorum]